jgi:hypothetical protein
MIAKAGKMVLPIQAPTEAPAAKFREEVLARAQGVVASILGSAAAPDQPLMEAGLDSIGARSVFIC